MKKINLFIISGIILAFLHIIFFVYQLNNNNIYLIDSYQYLDASENLCENGILYSGDLSKPIDLDLYTRRPPGYPVFIIIAKMLFKSDYSILFLQILLSIFTLLLILKLSVKELNVKTMVAFLLLVLFTPSQMIYSNLIMSEILLQFFVALVFLFLVMYLEKQHLIYLIICNILIGILMLIKPVFYLFFIPNFFYMLFLSIKKRMQYITLLSIFPILILVAYMSFNYSKTGMFSFSSIQSYNLMNVNYKNFLLKTKGDFIAENEINSVMSSANQIEDDVERKKYIDKETKKRIIDNIVSYTVYHFMGIPRFFFDPGRFDISTFFNIETKQQKGLMYYYNSEGWRGVVDYLVRKQPIGLTVAMVVILLLNVVKVFLMIIFFVQNRFGGEERIFLFTIIGYVAVLTGPLGVSRFSLPLFPLYLYMILKVLEAHAGGAAYSAGKRAI